MKKIYITAGLLMLGATATAQVLTNGQTSADLFNTNYFLDGSSFKNKLDPSVGKVLGFPQTDLTKFTFNLDVVENDVVTSGFDGVVVYNTATGKTLADASKGGKQVDVTPGFYYFSNPDGATNQTVSEGKWIRLSDTQANDQLWAQRDNNSITETYLIPADANGGFVGYNNNRRFYFNLGNVEESNFESGQFTFAELNTRFYT
ncbi:hypothetical protein [Riemerella columbina]|uniref:hypothetical protein n=1 Tax=Riemerella columbina TaxID=103810 RepID=UPI0003820DDD|nr:hypothetical protein [Riemerella columbina]